MVYEYYVRSMDGHDFAQSTIFNTVSIVYYPVRYFCVGGLD
jgi:hypothetical protein